MEFFEESNLELRTTDFVNEYEDMSVGEEVDYDYEELSEFYNSLTMAQKMVLMMVQKMALGEEVDYNEELYNSQTMAQKMALMMVQKMAQMMARSTLEENLENLENLYNGIESTLSSFMQVGINTISCIIFRIFTQLCKFFFVFFKIRILIR